MKAENIKDLTPVISKVSQMTDNTSLEPELLDNVKKAISNLEQAVKANDPKEVKGYAGKIAQFFLRDNLC